MVIRLSTDQPAPALITNSMEQSPRWESNRSSAGQEIPCILCNLNVHYHIYNSPSPIPILSQINPVHTPIPLLKIHFNIILPSMPGSSKWSLFLRSSHQNSICSPPLHQYVLHAPHLSFILSSEYRSLSSSLCSLRHFPVTFSLLGPNILLSSLFSNTTGLCSSLNVSNAVSHPYKTKGKIIVLYTLIFTFLDCKQENKRFCTES